MEKRFLLFFLTVVGFHCCVYSQYTNPFERVAVPDSIANKLEAAYNKVAKNVTAGRNVFNLADRKDFIFKDGIYSFQGQGPHFSRRIFIFNAGKIFIFENDGKSNPEVVIEEFLESIPLLNLTDRQIVMYINIIACYLEQEAGRTYGAEIK